MTLVFSRLMATLQILTDLSVKLVYNLHSNVNKIYNGPTKIFFTLILQCIVLALNIVNL